MESHYISIKDLVRPNGSKPTGRRVWSIDLETVWLPFFTATNTMGETGIANEALGAPLRLAYNADGTVKFGKPDKEGKTGKPVIKVAKELQGAVKLSRENFAAGLVAYAHEVFTENPDAYKAEIQANIEAGEPIREHDKQALDNAMTSMVEEVERAKPKAKAKAREAVAVTA